MTRRPSRRNWPKGLRSRQRSDGSTRMWWEPTPAARAAGFAAVDLDPDRLSWSVREAERLNAEAAQATGARRAGTGRRSMSALIADYRTHRSYLSKAAATRRSYDGLLSIIETKWGARPVAQFTKPAVATWYETNLAARGKTQAQRLNAMMSILFGHAELLGWRAENTNPAHGIRTEVPAPRGRVASWPEIDALVAAAEELGHHALALAILLAVYQGQRQTDIRTARRADFRPVQADNPATGQTETLLVWSLVRSKRATEGAMAIHPDIEPRLRRVLLANTAEADSPLLLDEATGQPYSIWLFNKRFIASRRRAAQTLPSVASLQFRDLRRTFGHLSRMGGASRDDTGDVLGNSAARDPKLTETYMAPQFWTATRAVLAVRRPTKPEGRKKA